ncbi:MAG: oxygen-independent coproporphyrinogen III oxidase [Leptonema sp. (in: bacteria)]
MKIEIHPSLVQKYDVQGPRYTSYPPVPNFDANFSEKDYINYLSEHSITKKISLYFHLPFCKSLCYYCGCNIFITSNQDIKRSYLDFLKKEIVLHRKYIPNGVIVKQLHWGGGTPNYLENSQISDLFSFIKNEFSFSSDAEISIELDPRTVQDEQLELLKDLGFNRISFGIQDLNDVVQKNINRVQPIEIIENLYYKSRKLNFDSINMDFIYGLPYQTLENYKNNLNKILEWKPDRLAFFSYAHVPWIKKHQNLLNVQHLPQAREKISIFKEIVETLTDNGYIYIGLDHFAKPEDELSQAFLKKQLHRNFQGYTVLDRMDVLAFGITSISQLQMCYVRNTKNIKEYKEKINTDKLPIFDGYLMTFDDILRKEIIHQIMCNLQVDFIEIENRFHINFKDYFSDSLKKLQQLEDDGIVAFSGNKIEVLTKGRPLIRNVAMCFDAFLERKDNSKKKIYSKTI